MNVTINGRQFRMACEDGEEDHLRELAQSFDSRIERLRARFGEIGDARLTVMAALTLADDLVEIGRKVRQLEQELATLQKARGLAAEHAQATQTALVAAFNSAAERIEAVARKLGESAAASSDGGVAQG